ncbi:MAG: eCIS core domain-containing protein [Gammaproteobacteria bacterium]
MPYRDLEPTATEKTASEPEGEVEAAQHRITRGNSWLGVNGATGNPGDALGKGTNGTFSRAGHNLLQLQNQYGNQFVQQLINPRQQITVQPKLMLGDVDTPSERQADRIASQATGGRPATSSPTLVSGTVMPVSPQIESRINQARGGGHPLPDQTRSQMEQSLGTDLSGVRIHTDSRADSLNQSLQAKAFTTGSDLFFRRGTYNPDSSGGKQLLAHELTHVVQQNIGGPQFIQRVPAEEAGEVYLNKITQLKEKIKSEIWDKVGDKFLEEFKKRSSDWQINNSSKEGFTKVAHGALRQSIQEYLDQLLPKRKQVLTDKGGFESADQFYTRIKGEMNEHFKQSENFVPPLADIFERRLKLDLFARLDKISAETILWRLKEYVVKKKGGSIIDEIDKYLESKMGVTGTLFRSTGLKKFQKQIKEKVGKKAYSDFENKLAESDDGGDQDENFPATHAYLEMKNKKSEMTIKKSSQAKKEIKTATKDTLTDMATFGAQEIARAIELPRLLEEAVVDAYLNLRVSGIDKDEALKMLTEALDKKSKNSVIATLNDTYKEIKELATLQAHVWSNKLTKSPYNPIENDLRKRVLDQKFIEKHVSELKIGETLHSKYKASSSQHAMSILSILLDLIVPIPGAQAKLDVEFRIPVGPSGGYILLGIKGTAARGLSGTINAAPTQDSKNDDRVEVRGDFTFGGGVELGAFTADGSIGVFLRAAGQNSIKASQAMSYGLYRFLAKKSEAAAGWWAGSMTDIGISKVEQAEIWATMVEEQVFRDNDAAAVDYGVYARGRVKGGVGAKAGGALVGAGFVRYNKSIIEKNISDQKNKIKELSSINEEKKKEEKKTPIAQNQNSLPNIDFAQTPHSKEEANIRRQAIGGQQFWVLAVKSTVATKGPVKKGAIAWTGAWSGGSLKTYEKSVSVDIQIPPGKTPFTGQLVKTLMITIFSAVAQVNKLLEKTDKELQQDNSVPDKIRIGSTVTNKATDVLHNHGLIQKGFDELNKIPDQKAEFLSSKTLRITYAEGMAGGKETTRLSFDEVSNLAVDFVLGKVKYEKSQRLLSIGSSGVKVYFK